DVLAVNGGDFKVAEHRGVRPAFGVGRAEEKRLRRMRVNLCAAEPTVQVVGQHGQSRGLGGSGSKADTVGTGKGKPSSAQRAATLSYTGLRSMLRREN